MRMKWFFKERQQWQEQYSQKKYPVTTIKLCWQDKLSFYMSELFVINETPGKYKLAVKLLPQEPGTGTKYSGAKMSSKMIFF